jgi:hypothetical protein
VAASSGLAMIRATRALDGLRWASDGFGRAGVVEFAVLPGGGDDDWACFGMAARPVCCSRAAGALWARLGLAGLVWV